MAVAHSAHFSEVWFGAMSTARRARKTTLRKRADNGQQWKVRLKSVPVSSALGCCRFWRGARSTTSTSTPSSTGARRGAPKGAGSCSSCSSCPCHCPCPFPCPCPCPCPCHQSQSQCIFLCLSVSSVSVCLSQSICLFVCVPACLPACLSVCEIAADWSLKVLESDSLSTPANLSDCI